jgi:hypothetical protein
VLFAFYELAIEPASVDRTVPVLVDCVQPFRVTPSDEAYAPAEVSSGRLKEKVKVVGHQSVGVNRQPESPRQFREESDELSAVMIGEKEWLASRSTVHHMVARARIVDAGTSSHCVSGSCHHTEKKLNC